MIKRLKIVSLLFIFCCCCILIDLFYNERNSVLEQNSIIHDEFESYDADNNDSLKGISYLSDYAGYIYIPRFDLKRLIVYGTDSDVLDKGYVGVYDLSACLECNDMIILAGHNISSVFHSLHYININDFVFINTRTINRKFYVYDKIVVDDSDIDYLYDNRVNELLLITCTDNVHERLLVFLKEVL